MFSLALYLIIFILTFIPYFLKVKFYGYDQLNVKNDNAINGVRGILASLVMFSHVFKELYIYLGNQWVYDKNYFELLSFGNQATNTGKIGVAIFFMISGYLFYRLLDKNKLDIKGFFANRFYRIYPLYAFVISICVLYIFLTGEEAINLLNLWETLKWYAFLGQYDEINIVEMTSGVEWTLKLEILMYTSIPVLFFLFSKTKNKIARHGFIIASILILFALGFLLRIYGKVYIDPRAVLCFYIGYLALELKNYSVLSFFKTKLAAFISIILFISSFFVTSHNLFYLYIILSCGFGFICLSAGNTIFGLLKTQQLQKLGEISYSIYLVHGLVLYFYMKLINYFEVTNEVYLLLSVIILFFITYSISGFTYLNIEQRFSQEKPLNKRLNANVNIN